MCPRARLSAQPQASSGIKRHRDQGSVVPPQASGIRKTSERRPLPRVNPGVRLQAGSINGPLWQSPTGVSATTGNGAAGSKSSHLTAADIRTPHGLKRVALLAGIADLCLTPPFARAPPTPRGPRQALTSMAPRRALCAAASPSLSAAAPVRPSPSPVAAFKAAAETLAVVSRAGVVTAGI